MVMIVVRAVVLLLGMAVASAAIAGQAAAPPTPEQLQIYATYRAWVTMQPDLRQAEDDVVCKRYAQELLRHGLTEAQAVSTVATLRNLGDRAERSPRRARGQN
jgi:hypothetical protein